MRNIKPLFKLLCHQKEDRSFRICDKTLFVCARCLGIYLGFVLTFLSLLLIYGLFTSGFRIFPMLLFFAPMGIDGLTQLMDWRESNNSLRFFTGYLGGMGLAYLVYGLYSIVYFTETVEPLKLPTILSLVPIIFFPSLLRALKNNSKNKLLKSFLNLIVTLTAIFLVISAVLVWIGLLSKGFTP